MATTTPKRFQMVPIVTTTTPHATREAARKLDRARPRIGGQSIRYHKGMSGVATISVYRKDMPSAIQALNTPTPNDPAIVPDKHGITQRGYRRNTLGAWYAKFQGLSFILLADRDGVVCYIGGDGMKFQHPTLAHSREFADKLQEWFNAACEVFGTSEPDSAGITFLGYGLFPQFLIDNE